MKIQVVLKKLEEIWDKYVTNKAQGGHMNAIDFRSSLEKGLLLSASSNNNNEVIEGSQQLKITEQL